MASQPGHPEVPGQRAHGGGFKSENTIVSARGRRRPQAPTSRTSGCANARKYDFKSSSLYGQSTEVPCKSRQNPIIGHFAPCHAAARARRTACVALRPHHVQLPLPGTPRRGPLVCPLPPLPRHLLPSSVATLPGGQPPASAGSMAVPSAMPGDGAPQHHRTHGAITVRCGSALPQGAARGWCVCVCSHFHHHHLTSSRRRKQHSPSSERHGKRWGRSHAPPAAGGSSSSRTIEAMSASHASPPSSSLR